MIVFCGKSESIRQFTSNIICESNVFFFQKSHIFSFCVKKSLLQFFINIYFHFCWTTGWQDIKDHSQRKKNISVLCNYDQKGDVYGTPFQSIFKQP